MMSTEVPPDDVELTQPSAPLAPMTAFTVSGLFGRQAFALIKKEWCELRPWLAGMALIFSSLLAWVICSSFTFFGYGHEILAPRVLQSEKLTFITALFGPLIAFMVGAVQFMRENKVSSYALLMHRPMARTAIFATKAAFGLAAYAVVVLLPMAAMMDSLRFLTITPDAAIHWPKTPLVALLMGTLFYFLGCLIVARPGAHWYGSLILPVLWTTAAGLVAGMQTEFWKMMYLWLIGLSPLVVAAHGSYTTFGQIRSQRWFSRLSLGVLTVFGIYSLCALFFSVLIGLTASRTPMVDGEWRETRVLKNGTPVQVRLSQISAEYESMDGTVKYLLSDLPHVSPLCHIPPRRDHFYRIDRNHSVYPYQGATIVSQGVYYKVLPSSDCTYAQLIIGDRDTEHYKTGILDADGVRWGRSEPGRRFASPMIPLAPFGLVTGNTLYELLPDGKLNALLISPDGKPFTDIEISEWPLNLPSNQADIFAATPNHIYRIRVVREAAAQTYRADVRATYPREFSDREVVLMYDGDSLLAVRYDAVNRSEPSVLVTYKPDGNRSRQEVPQPQWHENIPLPRKGIQASAPLLFGLPLIGLDRYYENRKYQDEGQLAMEPLPLALKRTLYGGISLGLASSALMWLIMTRQGYARRRKMLWLGLTFLGGPAMLLVQRVIVPPRVLEKCPDCHRKRPVELTQCPHCGKPWPASERNGKEIFANAAN